MKRDITPLEGAVSHFCCSEPANNQQAWEITLETFLYRLNG